MWLNILLVLVSHLYECLPLIMKLRRTNDRHMMFTPRLIVIGMMVLSERSRSTNNRNFVDLALVFPYTFRIYHTVFSFSIFSAVCEQLFLLLHLIVVL